MDEIYQAIGIRISVLTAGLIGGVISLSLTSNLTPARALTTVIAGAASAAYLTPIAVAYFELGEGAENALAFLLGVSGMNALAGFFRMSENFAKSPLSTLRSFRVGEDR